MRANKALVGNVWRAQASVRLSIVRRPPSIPIQSSPICSKVGWGACSSLGLVRAQARCGSPRQLAPWRRQALRQLRVQIPCRSSRRALGRRAHTASSARIGRRHLAARRAPWLVVVAISGPGCAVGQVGEAGTREASKRRGLPPADHRGASPRAEGSRCPFDLFLGQTSQVAR